MISTNPSDGQGGGSPVGGVPSPSADNKLGLYIAIGVSVAIAAAILIWKLV